MRNVFLGSEFDTGLCRNGHARQQDGKAHGQWIAGRGAGIQGRQPVGLGVGFGQLRQEDAQGMGLIQDLQHA